MSAMDSYESLIKRGDEAQDSQEYEVSLGYYKRALVIEPKNPEVYKNIGKHSFRKMSHKQVFSVLKVL